MGRRTDGSKHCCLLLADACGPHRALNYSREPSVSRFGDGAQLQNIVFNALPAAPVTDTRLGGYVHLGQ